MEGESTNRVTLALLQDIFVNHGERGGAGVPLLSEPRAGKDAPESCAFRPGWSLKEKGEPALAGQGHDGKEEDVTFLCGSTNLSRL